MSIRTPRTPHLRQNENRELEKKIRELELDLRDVTAAKFKDDHACELLRQYITHKEAMYEVGVDDLDGSEAKMEFVRKRVVKLIDLIESELISTRTELEEVKNDQMDQLINEMGGLSEIESSIRDIKLIREMVRNEDAVGAVDSLMRENRDLESSDERNQKIIENFSKELNEIEQKIGAKYQKEIQATKDECQKKIEEMRMRFNSDAEEMRKKYEEISSSGSTQKEHELAKIREELTRIGEELSNKDHELSQKENELAQKDYELAELRIKAGESSERIEQLRSQLADGERIIGDSAKRIEQLNQQLAESEQQRIDLAEDSDKIIEELKHQASVSDQLRTELETERQKSADTIKRSTDGELAVEELKRQLSDSAKTVKELKHQLTESEQRRAKLAEESSKNMEKLMADRDAERSTFTENNELLKETVKDLEATVNNLETKCTASENENKTLQAQIAKTNKEITALKSETQSAKTEISRLTAENTKLKSFKTQGEAPKTPHPKKQMTQAEQQLKSKLIEAETRYEELMDSKNAFVTTVSNLTGGKTEQDIIDAIKRHNNTLHELGCDTDEQLIEKVNESSNAILAIYNKLTKQKETELKPEFIAESVSEVESIVSSVDSFAEDVSEQPASCDIKDVLERYETETHAAKDLKDDAEKYQAIIGSSLDYASKTHRKFVLIVILIFVYVVYTRILQ